MATQSSTLAWRIPWMEEPGGLQSMGLHRVGHDRATSLSLFTFLHWRRKWQLTPVFLPGEHHGRRSLVGCSPWGCTELDTTERLQKVAPFGPWKPLLGSGGCTGVGCVGPVQSFPACCIHLVVLGSASYVSHHLSHE